MHIRCLKGFLYYMYLYYMCTNTCTINEKKTILPSLFHLKKFENDFRENVGTFNSLFAK